MCKKINTEEYYLASIDLLGIKEIILSDKEDTKLNQIHNIYKSWPRILRNSYYQNMRIRFFSDNFVIAIKSDEPRAADKLLSTIADICVHFLRCGYKPRGGVTKGQFYIDDVFVWGQGLVAAYLIESNQAKYPRIVIDDVVVNDATHHLADILFLKDEDGKIILNYLRGFGRSKEIWLNYINTVLMWLKPEIDMVMEMSKNNNSNAEIRKVYEKLTWLLGYVEEQKQYWQCYKSQ